MASSPSAVATAPTLGERSENYTFALIVLTSLFFKWGFITVLNDILIPHLRNVFDLGNL